MKSENLINNEGYWTSKIQIDLFNELENYMVENGINRSQLATRMGVTKGYISQVLNGDFNHRISKLVELALFIGKVPIIEFKDIKSFTEQKETEVFNKDYREAIIFRE